MSDRRYKLNRKALAVTRALSNEPGHDAKWDYIYVGPDYVCCTNTTKFLRVSTPQPGNNSEGLKGTVFHDPQPTVPVIFPRAVVDEMRKKCHGDNVIEMPEGLPAVSNGTFSVPNFSYAVPKPEFEENSICVTGKDLIDLVQTMNEVTEHSRYILKLRICKIGPKPLLRIDTHHDDGGQECTGILMGTKYDGVNISGDRPENVPPPEKQTEKFDEAKIELPMETGRKFRI